MYVAVNLKMIDDRIHKQNEQMTREKQGQKSEQAQGHPS
jgi:hypothetical protein